MLQVPTSIVPFIKSQFPDFYASEGPMFIAFVEAYYEWVALNQDRQLLANRDIDLTPDKFLINFKDTYLINLEFDNASNKRLLIKNALNIYRSKGTPRGIDLFMKLMYGTSAQVYFPGDDVFKTSDGKWLEPQFLEVTRTGDAGSLVERVIKGSASGATAYVEGTMQLRAGDIADTINITNISGEFIIGERVYVDRITAESPIILGSVVRGKIAVSAIGWSKGVELTMRNSRGDLGVARISGLAADGKINKLKIIDSGVGFRAGELITLYSGDQAAATMNPVMSAVGHRRGFFNTTDGFVSANKHLQDGNYYQDHSYEVISAIPFEKYQDVLKDVLHVAGKKAFGSIVVVSSPVIHPITMSSSVTQE